MGGNQSNSGNLFVQTDKPYYGAGDTVTGHVYANIYDYYPGDTVFLKFKGIEYSWWRESYQESYNETNAQGQSVSRSRTAYRYHSATNKFYNHKFCIHSWGQSLIPGQYAFPYQFVLQSHLPGTFYESTVEYKAIIKYKVKAEILSHTLNVKKLKHHQQLVVREPLKQLVESVSVDQTVNAKTCCCIDQGISEIRCYFQSNMYQAGETAVIVDEIDNSRCKLNIKSIQASLEKTIRLNSNFGMAKTFYERVSQMNYMGMLAGESRKADNKLFHNLPLVSLNHNVLNPSTNGQYVSCHYRLKVTAVLEGCTCCSSDPSVEIPIVLMAPPPPNYGQIQQPSNWQPQVYDVKTIAFTDSMMYGPPQGQQSNNKIDKNHGSNQQQQFIPPQQQQPYQNSNQMISQQGYQPPQLNQQSQGQQGYQPPHQQQQFQVPPQQQQLGAHQQQFQGPQ